jgi:hypothetical protein
MRTLTIVLIALGLALPAFSQTSIPPDAPAPQDNSPSKPSKGTPSIVGGRRTVGAGTQTPPLSAKDKFMLATRNSFDWTSLVRAGMVAGIGQARDSYPEFHQGAAGFGRYYWHAYADQAVSNYFTQFIVPAATHEDPRYYVRGHGGVFSRTGYALSRLFVTRTDSGDPTVNLAEIVGSGAAAGVSSRYYPQPERTWTKTGHRWVTLVGIDGALNVLEEFWPSIRHGVFRK